MYNNQQPKQYEKNPNGGYVKPSQHGPDRFFGTLEITPQLMQQIQQAGGKVFVDIKEVRHSNYGPCRRVLLKPCTEQKKAPSAQGGYQQNYNQAQGGYQQPQAPQYQAPLQPQPSYNASSNYSNGPLQDDDIPWG